ncbi:MAG: GspE/PulE family protein [bacterium]
MGTNKKTINKEKSEEKTEDQLEEQTEEQTEEKEGEATGQEEKEEREDGDEEKEIQEPSEEKTEDQPEEQTEEQSKEQVKEQAPPQVKKNTEFHCSIDNPNAAAPEIINNLIEDALKHRASDVHIEPQHKEVVVRFRIDGVLYEICKIPKLSYENILNRVKVQAHLRVDEHFSAQDGSLRHDLKENVIDVRVSIVPTIEGEKIVMRMLAVYVPNLSLEDLGVSEEDQQKLLRAVKKPFGMILAVGPTGSGKTTTLYALLKTLRVSEINLTTVEDPVEYKIYGANQIQVNLQTNLTFAKGLRSIVRQDPDVILVGEIRDDETAEMAVNSALTGHLLFSTFHANDAATGIPRLLDMGIEPFLLASTLEVISAQRLVRKICEECKQKATFDLRKLETFLPSVGKYFSSKNLSAYMGKGCSHCNNKGYQGRTAIYEIITITPEMRDLILRNPSSQEVAQLARKQGSKSLFEDGVEKVREGITTPEELFRVASPPEVEYLSFKAKSKLTKQSNESPEKSK